MTGRGRSGNTPTGVGKTDHLTPEGGSSWKHPHWRGEDWMSVNEKLRDVETPPLAWGRRVLRDRQEYRPGNTPTGVGKTIY